MGSEFARVLGYKIRRREFYSVVVTGHNGNNDIVHETAYIKSAIAIAREINVAHEAAVQKAVLAERERCHGIARRMFDAGGFQSAEAVDMGKAIADAIMRAP